MNPYYTSQWILSKRVMFSALIAFVFFITLLIVQPIGLIHMESLQKKVVLTVLLGFSYGLICLLQIQMAKFFFRKGQYNQIRVVFYNVIFLLLTLIVSSILIKLLHPYAMKINPERIIISSIGFILIFQLIAYFLSKRMTIGEAQNIKTDEQEPVLRLTDNSTTINIPINNVYYIKSTGNYIEIIEKNNIKGHLLRHSLSNIEQLFDELYRCHKSYIVNINRICSINGNSKGYYLKFTDLPDLTLPVSRTKGKDLIEIISGKTL